MDRRVGTVVAALLLAGCSGNDNLASQLVDAPDFEPEGQAKCKVGASQDKPLIVEWPSGERADLEARSRQGGLVVVRYEGCEMQILSRCKAPGSYAYIPVTTKQDTLVIENEDELYANLPVGAVKLEGKLQSAGSLNVTMTLVGKFAADRFEVLNDELHGACDGATHVVVGMNVGAFEFFAGGGAEVGAGVTVGNAGAGAKSTAKRETLSRDGNTAACEKATTDDEGPPTGCGASLRLEVAPLAIAAVTGDPEPPPTKLVCPAGTTLTDGMCQPKVSRNCPDGMKFAAGRGCIPVVAPVQAVALPTKGSPSRGPADAKVVIQWFGGYQDPFSRKANTTLGELLKRRAGDVRLIFRHAPLGFHKMGRPAAYAAVEAFAQKGNDGFWRMHDALFAIRKLDEAKIRAAAKNLGLDMARFDDAMAKGTHKAKVDEDFALFNARGFRGTPTFTVGKDIVNGAQPLVKFENAVDRVIAGEDGQPAGGPALKVPTGAPTLGPASAPVVIQWFGSFQEPFTAKAAPVIDEVMRRYPGKIRLVWRHHTLPQHDRAIPAAKVALLAHEKGRFWDMQRILINNRTKLSDADLVTYGKQLRLDPAEVLSTIRGPKYAQVLEADNVEARNQRATGVPTFFINGTKLRGARDFAAFKKLIDEALAR